jgi:hypothetical protein
MIYSHDEADKMNRRNGVLQGFKASISVANTYSQGLCKASARDPSICSKILVKGYAREGFKERSYSSFIQSDTVPETNRYAPPTS